MQQLQRQFKLESKRDPNQQLRYPKLASHGRERTGNSLFTRVIAVMITRGRRRQVLQRRRMSGRGERRRPSAIGLRQARDVRRRVVMDAHNAWRQRRQIFQRRRTGLQWAQGGGRRSRRRRARGQGRSPTGRTGNRRGSAGTRSLAFG